MKIFENFKIQGCHWLPCEILNLLVFFCKFFSCRKAPNLFIFEARGLFFKRFCSFLETQGGFQKIPFVFYLATGSSSLSRARPSVAAVRGDARYRLPSAFKKPSAAKTKP